MVNSILYAEQIFFFTSGFATALLIVTIWRAVNGKRKYRVKVRREKRSTNSSEQSSQDTGAQLAGEATPTQQAS